MENVMMIKFWEKHVSTVKKDKIENGQENRSFFHFSNFEVKFKNTKNTDNG